MKDIYGSKYCSLHVRITNRAAIGMYSDVLKYETIDIENEYYADKEDALDMVLFFDPKVRI
jgi:ribosomal protein S18 acetylase RimI-like enzyme